MGVSKTGYKGVTVTPDNSIRVEFTIDSQRCREIVDGEPTAANLKLTSDWLGSVRLAIRNGTFDYLAAFPKSTRAYQFINKRVLSTFLLDWHTKQKHLKAAPFRQYRLTIEGQINNTPLGKMHVAAIEWKHIKKWALEKDILPKTRRNYMSVLRTALDDAVDEKIILVNPMLGKKLKSPSVMKKSKTHAVDPFDWDERKAIVAACNDEFKWFVDFGFWTGLRIGELVALRWEHVSFIKNEISVEESISMAATEAEAPKTTAGIRTVELHGPALAALKALKAHTYMEAEFVFHNPYFNKRWRGDTPIRKKWKRLLHRAGVRYRSPKQMRHTYISTSLMAGEPVSYVCAQVGHEDERVTYAHYSRFIPGNDKNAGSRMEEEWKKAQ